MGGGRGRLRPFAQRQQLGEAAESLRVLLVAQGGHEGFVKGLSGIAGLRKLRQHALPLEFETMPAGGDEQRGAAVRVGSQREGAWARARRNDGVGIGAQVDVVEGEAGDLPEGVAQENADDVGR